MFKKPCNSKSWRSQGSLALPKQSLLLLPLPRSDLCIPPWVTNWWRYKKLDIHNIRLSWSPDTQRYQQHPPWYLRSLWSSCIAQDCSLDMIPATYSFGPFLIIVFALVTNIIIVIIFAYLWTRSGESLITTIARGAGIGEQTVAPKSRIFSISSVTSPLEAVILRPTCSRIGQFCLTYLGGFSTAVISLKGL